MNKILKYFVEKISRESKSRTKVVFWCGSSNFYFIKFLIYVYTLQKKQKTRILIYKVGAKIA